MRRRSPAPPSNARPSGRPVRGACGVKPGTAAGGTKAHSTNTSTETEIASPSASAKPEAAWARPTPAALTSIELCRTSL